MRRCITSDWMEHWRHRGDVSITILSSHKTTEIFVIAICCSQATSQPNMTNNSAVPLFYFSSTAGTLFSLHKLRSKEPTSCKNNHYFDNCNQFNMLLVCTGRTPAKEHRYNLHSHTHAAAVPYIKHRSISNFKIRQNKTPWRWSWQTETCRSCRNYLNEVTCFNV